MLSQLASFFLPPRPSLLSQATRGLCACGVTQRYFSATPSLARNPWKGTGLSTRKRLARLDVSPKPQHKKPPGLGLPHNSGSMKTKPRIPTEGTQKGTIRTGKRESPKPSVQETPKRKAENSASSHGVKEERRYNREQVDLRTKLKVELTEANQPSPALMDIHNFQSPPLLPGLIESLKQVIGTSAKPTAIQSLSIAHFLRSSKKSPWHRGIVPAGSATLLAAETGSGKSIAYLLPVLQSLKQSELSSSRQPATDLKAPEIRLEDAPPSEGTTPGPRAIILCPTHELCRQIAVYAKSLCHTIKLRVVCSSNPNQGSSSEAWKEDAFPRDASRHPIDILVATPSKVLNLIGGLAMSNDRITNATRRARSNAQDELSDQDTNGRLSLDHLEWLVVDEADVMFDRDFVDTTEAIIDHIVEARGGTPSATNDGQLTANSLPFNLILSSATIPVSLSNYLDKNIPQTVRLASPRIHQLPKRLKTEYVQLTDGNKMASIAKKIESVWAEDAAARAARKPQGQSTITRGKSKVVVFCNNIRGAKRLSEYLEKKNISSLVMGGIDGDRLKGSNKHLAGFLNPAALSSTLTNHTSTPMEGPRVLITTSLLSRGLDFDPSITHVFVADEPRSAVDFIHRAGRTGRAGNVGTVVLFEKGSRGARRAAGKATRAEDFGKIRKSRH